MQHPRRFAAMPFELNRNRCSDWTGIGVHFQPDSLFRLTGMRRRERSCADAIEQCFNTLAGKNSAEWILEGDIKACFDRIDHNWLLSHLSIEKEVLRKWLKSGHMVSHVFHTTREGTPQRGQKRDITSAIRVTDGRGCRWRTSRKAAGVVSCAFPSMGYG